MIENLETLINMPPSPPVSFPTAQFLLCLSSHPQLDSFSSIPRERPKGGQGEILHGAGDNFLLPFLASGTAQKSVISWTYNLPLIFLALSHGKSLYNFSLLWYISSVPHCSYIHISVAATRCQQTTTECHDEHYSSAISHESQPSSPVGTSHSLPGNGTSARTGKPYRKWVRQEVGAIISMPPVTMQLQQWHRLLCQRSAGWCKPDKLSARFHSVAKTVSHRQACDSAYLRILSLTRFFDLFRMHNTQEVVRSRQISRGCSIDENMYHMTGSVSSLSNSSSSSSVYSTDEDRLSENYGHLRRWTTSLTPSQLVTVHYYWV